MDNRLVLNTYQPIPKQESAHMAQDGRTEVCSLLYGGAKGGGKTVWLCWEAYRLSLKY